MNLHYVNFMWQLTSMEWCTKSISFRFISSCQELKKMFCRISTQTWSRWSHFKVKEEIPLWIARWCCSNPRDSGCKRWGAGVDRLVVHWLLSPASAASSCRNRRVEVRGYGGARGMFDRTSWQFLFYHHPKSLS